MFTSTGSSPICHTDVVIHSRRSSTKTFRPCRPTQPPKFLLTVTPRVRNAHPFPQKHPNELLELSLSLAVWSKSRFLFAVTLFSVSSNCLAKVRNSSAWISTEGGQLLTGISRCLRNKLMIKNESPVLCVAHTTGLVYLFSLTPWQIFCSVDHDPGGE